MQAQLNELKTKSLTAIAQADSSKALEEIKISIFGKKGELTALLKSLGTMSKEERPAFGAMVNEVRQELEAAFEARKSAVSEAELLSRLANEQIDVTMPGSRRARGVLHPLTQVIEEANEIFLGMGYEIVTGPDIETIYYNFDALNHSPGHPARDAQDTFYTEDGFVLRTSTSPMQVRVMEAGKLPIRVIAPGKVFRSDPVDATHSPVFHQLEGLVVDKGITMGDLKGTLLMFAKELFGDNARFRFRPHYFPFTEPSAEMDASCFACDGKGCRICKGEGWIELLGCGMVHPNVLKMSGIDPVVYSGFAFGMGLDRLAMQRFNISDMRLLFENDVKFLQQF